VFLTIGITGMSLRQLTLISWVGLRGAVPIILATFPLLAGVKNAELYFNIVFFTVFTSVLLQGTTLPRLARFLKLDAPLPASREYPLEFAPIRGTSSDLVRVTIPSGSPVIGKRILDLPMPASSLAVLISRGDYFLVPRGATVLEAGDTVLLLAEAQDLPEVRKLLIESAPAQAGTQATSRPGH
jgi:cell volume regulation protein A